MSWIFVSGYCELVGGGVHYKQGRGQFNLCKIMINQQLIDYIKQQSQQGVSPENIKNALRLNNWTDTDINQAYSSLSTSAPVSKFNKKIIWIPAVLLLLVAGGVFAFISYTSKLVAVVSPALDTSTPTPTSTDVSVSTNPVSKTTTTSNPDIGRVTAIMVDICQGYLTSNNSLIIKHASIQTVGFLSGVKLDPASACTVNKIYQSNTNIIANVTVVSTPSEKLSTKLSPVQDMVFIKEGGDWKFDMTATIKFAMDQSKAKAGTGDPNGFVDLVITSAIVSPSHPIVNSKEIQIVITIKNIGTKTSDSGALLVADLLGFNDEVPMTGGNYGPLAAGGTVKWTWYPYKYNDSFRISDTPGQKTIKIELNPGRTIVESNYTNNVFTQMVQMYSN